MTSLSTIVGDATTSTKAELSSVSNFVKDLTSKEKLGNNALAVGGAVAGVLYFKKAKVLGGIGGAILGHNLPGLLQGYSRRDAVVNITQGAAGLGVARMLKHQGWFVQLLAGGAAYVASGMALKSFR